LCFSTQLFRCTYAQGPSGGVHRELEFAGCPDPNADGNGDLPADFICDFPVFISGFFIEGLPAPAVAAHAKHNLNTGHTTTVKIYRLDGNNDCTSPPFVHKAAGINFENPSDDGFVWKGNFVLFRPRGQISNDPGGFDVDGRGGFFVLNGRLTFEDTSFTIKKYVGKKPVDVCALLA